MPIIGPYLGVLRRPGALGFTTAAFIARVPIAMVGLGIVLLISAIRGSFAEAGLLTAGYAFAAALGNPLGSRLVDRWGQWPVAGVLVLVHAVALLAFAMLALAGAPVLPLLVLAAITGAAQPATGAFVRARWATLIDDPGPLRTAFAWESILDELIFVIGPPLATVLAVVAGSAVPLFVSAGLVVVGTAALLAQRSSQPVIVRHDRTVPRRRLIANRGFLPVIVLMVSLGSVFGSLEVVSVAAADEAGARGAAALILAVYAFGSLVAGVIVGSRIGPDRDLARDLVIGTVLLVAVTVPFVLVSGIPALAVAALLAGLAVSPVLILGFARIQQVIPPARLTEGLTWATSGLGLGVALSAALSGWVVDLGGSRVGFVVTVAAAASGLAATASARLHSRRRRPDATRSGHNGRHGDEGRLGRQGPSIDSPGPATGPGTGPDAAPTPEGLR